MKLSIIVRLRKRPRVLVGLLVVIALGSSLLIARQVLPSHVYWSQPDQDRMTRDVASLHKVLPTLEQLQVEEFRNQDWCRNLAYSGGRFSNTLQTTCNLFDGSPVDFTSKANADFARIADALNSSGVWIHLVWQVQYDAAGRATYAEFDLNPAPWDSHRWSYVYDPGGPLPADMVNEESYTRIDSDWYFHWEDWM